ncbi:ImmA/IrrE family metallo-endopeptidase [Enterococcus sp. SMC-9]|uniref:ImmA/IrrE family metallo-endopeptidase n=1 Tax=Enterococcus sp. SMC-9 TaxID=2862343 RepID=UPI001E3A0246|nr:ImmA/IrrE family metallo-endopeptidase [Enterococcus sp. SMC-9]MCD1023508.1 ImmA/IrrE family metallo-endopeptidase [Enterococcus sp. SMC-9]
MSVEAEEFLAFSYKINDYISALMFGMDMNARSYDYREIWDYIMSDQIVLRKYPFNGKARQNISGMIVKDDLEVTLAVNNNMAIKRQNFTISHELIHYLYHLNEDTPVFTDDKVSLAYSSADLLPEFQANIGASVILLPDPVLISELKQQKSIAHVSAEYGISEAAIFTRLVQTMQARFNASYITAYKLANKIMNGRAKNQMIELGKNLERVVEMEHSLYEVIK